MNDLIIQIIAYWGFFFAGLVLLIFLTRGFLLQWLKVITSMGKKILIQVQDPIQDYFITGKIQGGFLLLKDRESKGENGSDMNKQIKFSSDLIFRAYGVNCVKFNDQKNAFLKTDMTGVMGWDAIAMDNLLQRALTRPESTADNRNKIITMIACIVSVLIGLLIYFKLTGIEKSINIFMSNPTTGVIPSAFAIFRNRK